MKLLRLKVDGFGVLRGEYVFDPARMVIVVDDNERGKSSLLGAITALLYGLESDGRRSRSLLTPLERWRPWDGGDYRVEMELETGGERWRVTRDFARGTTAVLDARGNDVTHDFRAGKDEYPVGQRLLGLDADEFAKCALWRQGELDQVVPHEEKDRRSSTLHTRLEAAADTRAGDASAIEARKALRAAVEKFHSPLLGTPLRIENAQTRLVLQRDTLESDARSLQSEYREIQGPLEELARLEDEDREARARITALEQDVLRRRAVEARERLVRDSERRENIERLRAEAGSLAGAAGVPDNAESVLREQVALLTAAEQAFAASQARLEAIEAEHARVAARHAAGEPWSRYSEDDERRIASAATILRRIEDDVANAGTELATLEARHTASGVDTGRAEALARRFTDDDGRLALLRQQSRFALAVQGDLAAAEFARKSGRDALRAIAAWKRPRYALASVLLALGIALEVAGATVAPESLRTPALIAGSLVALAGLAWLMLTARARVRDRDAAAQRREQADDQVRLTRLRTTENDTRLAQLAAEIGCPNAATLLDEWNEYELVREHHAPLLAARARYAALEQQREAARAQAAEWLGAAGVAADTDALDAAARAIREQREHTLTLAMTARRVLDAQNEADALARTAAAHRSGAQAALAAAGIAVDDGASWPARIARVAARVRQAGRHRELDAGLIPAIERELLSDAQRDACLDEAARGDSGGGDMPAAATPAAIAREVLGLRQRLDTIARTREELRLRVEGVARRYHHEHPDKLARIAVLEREIARTARFGEAITVAGETIERVARETHRRWADFLNQRVGELLEAFGSSVGSVRFGDDLDFAVTLPGGRQAARGRAVHQLSSGARDQLHLAVRLAISEYLSRGTSPIPLLIDDCFATSDDTRTRNGMRVLIEAFSRQHQIVMVTCHRERHRGLASLDEALYSERVQWVELRPGVVA